MNIRRNILQARDAMSKEARERAAILLTERILGHQWYYRAEILLCFVSYGSEISTRDILTDALKAGKEVYVPKVLQDGAYFCKGIIPEDSGLECREPEMAFYRIASLDELKKGYKGIPEPPLDTQEYVYRPELAERTLMLMPGVAFDRFRNRIGYGKGFYDRYLADKPGLQLKTIAVGYQCQMVEELPVSEWDVKPYQVICV